MFAHLHTHSHFSNTLGPDAFGSPTALVEAAKAAGFSAVALTDHGTVSGIPEFIKAAKAAGVKALPGCELYVVDDPAWRPEKGAPRQKDYVHIIALARTWTGFEELLGLLTKANSDPGFYYKPRSAFADLYATKDLVFTTACAGGLLRRDDYLAKAAEFAAAVGPGRLYVEIQPHADESQVAINARAIEVSRALGLPLVAAQDSHYPMAEDAETHEVILAIGSQAVWSDPTRWRYPVDDLFLKSAGEMIAAFGRHIGTGALAPADVMAAFKGTIDIADQVDFEWKALPISLPDMGAEPERQVLMACIDALKERGLLSNTQYVERLAYEVKVLKESGFISYFLMLSDIINWSRKSGIAVGPGRGSSGGSLVCFLLGITTIDPILHDLLFERFYRPGRVDLPDIDTDFEDERRGEVLEYVRRRFGEDRTANVASYMMLGAKGALRDVCRVFEIDRRPLDIALASVDDGLPDEEVFENKGVADLLRMYPHVGRHARKLCGWMRTTGQHAAGVVIAGEPLHHHAVVTYRDGRSIVNWDKDVIEGMGLMKLDVLGLRTLSILRNAAENVFRSRGIRIDFNAIPLDDPKTLEVFQRGDTTGVFQFESRGMRALLKGLRLDRFSLIADATALYRPGPMELIPKYTAAQTGETRVFFDHPLLEPILGPTFGVMIYQEQLMRVFSDVGGFSYAEADKMRKIVGKKLGPDEFKKHEGDFVEGAVKNGVSEATARKIFSDMVNFAGYGFNKSHAHAYSIISFWCAYMKAHHTAAFFAAHLSNSADDKAILAVNDAIEAGMEIRMPDINASDAKAFVPLNDRIILAPLAAIKGIGDKAALCIAEARNGLRDVNGLVAGETRSEKAGLVSFNPAGVARRPFSDGADFLARVYKRLVNKGIQEKLRRVGALPWDTPDDEEMDVARKELLGAFYRRNLFVEQGATLLWDEHNQRRMKSMYEEMVAAAQAIKMTPVIPASGSKPRIMLVFEAPDWKDESSGHLGHGNGYEVFRKIAADVLGITARDFYLTSLYRTRKPPLGFESVADQAKLWLQSEIELLKPPVIIAFGKAPIEFFVGAGARVGEYAGQVLEHGKSLVMCCPAPGHKNADPQSAAEAHAKVLPVVEKLKEYYVP